MKHTPSDFGRPASASGTQLPLPLKTPRAWSSCKEMPPRCLDHGGLGIHLLPSWSPQLDPEPDGTCDPLESTKRASPQVSLGESHRPPEGRLSSIRNPRASQSCDAAVGFRLNLQLENSSP